MEHNIYYHSGLLLFFVQDEPTEGQVDNSRPSGYAASKDVLMLSLVEQTDI